MRHPHASSLHLELMVASPSCFVLFCFLNFVASFEGDEDDDDEWLAADIYNEYIITECINRPDSLGECK